MKWTDKSFDVLCKANGRRIEGVYLVDGHVFFDFEEGLRMKLLFERQEQTGVIIGDVEFTGRSLTWALK